MLNPFRLTAVSIVYPGLDALSNPIATFQILRKKIKKNKKIYRRNRSQVRASQQILESIADLAA
jgi:hypothetical protein